MPPLVLFASVLVGAHKGFAHVRTEDVGLAALQRLLFADLWAARARCEHAIEGPVHHLLDQAGELLDQLKTPAYARPTLLAPSGSGAPPGTGPPQA